MASSYSNEITRSDLQDCFRMTINKASKRFGICATVLKKKCRQNGIKRWPYRKIHSLYNLIESLESTDGNPETIEYLKYCAEKLTDNPNISLKSLVGKSYRDAIQPKSPVQPKMTVANLIISESNREELCRQLQFNEIIVIDALCQLESLSPEYSLVGDISVM